MVINVFKAMHYPKDFENEGCMRVDVIDILVQETQTEDSMLALHANLDDSIEEIDEVSEGPVSRDLEAEKPKQELKPLPPTLKYAYLGEGNSFLVIISSSLSSKEEDELL
ncbi:hypothetical protein PIB30_063681 [Stylosanthes scabra]|uniref:Uncharacterized protein n=1 Tax=Stylosanthes scabra TaxID=79078 RepID=A0ABU6UKJ0_9FABA|nr:hypothetical protein [Stylosanthes scabra]